MRRHAIKRLLVGVRSCEQHSQGGAFITSSEAWNEAQRCYYARKAAVQPKGFVDINDPRLRPWKRQGSPQYLKPDNEEGMQQALQQWEKPKRELKTIRHRLHVPLEPEQRQALHAALVQQLQVSGSVADIAIKAVESGIVFIPRSYHSGRTTAEGAPAAELAVLTGRLRTLLEAQARLPGFDVEKVLRRDPLVLRMRPAQLRRTVRVLTEQAPDADPGLLLMAASRRVRRSAESFCAELHELRRTMHQRLGLDPVAGAAVGSYRSQVLQVRGSAAQAKMDRLLLKLVRREQLREARRRKQDKLVAGGRRQQQQQQQQQLADTSVAALLEPSSTAAGAGSEAQPDAAAEEQQHWQPDAVVPATSRSSEGPELDQQLMRSLQALVQTIYRKSPMLLKYDAGTLARKVAVLERQLGADAAAVRDMLARCPAVLAADLSRLPGAIKQLQQLQLTQQDAQQLLLAEPLLISSKSVVAGIPARLQELQQLLRLPSKHVAVAMVLRHPRLLRTGLRGLEARLQQLPEALGRDEGYVQRLLVAHPLLATYTVATLSQRVQLLQQLAAGSAGWSQEVQAMDAKVLGRCLLAGKAAYEGLAGLVQGGSAAQLAALEGLKLRDVVCMSSEQLAALPAASA